MVGVVALASMLLLGGADVALSLQLRTEGRAQFFGHLPPRQEAERYDVGLGPAVAASVAWRQWLVQAQYGAQLLRRVNEPKRNLTLQTAQLSLRRGHESSSLWEAGAHVVVGEIDTFQAVQEWGRAPGQLTNLPTTQVLSYYSAMGSLAYSRRLSSAWLLRLNNRATTMESRGAARQDRFLLPQTRLEITPGVQLWPGRRDSWAADVELSRIEFRDRCLYHGVTPMLEWQKQLSVQTRWRVQAGSSIVYKQLPHDSGRDGPRLLPVATVELTSSLLRWGRQRLSGRATLGVAPFYDMTLASVDPRSVLGAGLAWQVSPDLSVGLQGQMQTLLVFEAGRYVGGRQVRSDNLATADVSLMYRINEVLGVQVGMMGVFRWDRTAWQPRDENENYLAFAALSTHVSVLQ